MGKGGKVIMRAYIPSLTRTLHLLGVDSDGAVQNKVTDEVMEALPDYMPKRTGRLIEGVTKVSPTRIRVPGVQARFLFFGKTKTGAPVKYSREANPNAGPDWLRRMKAERGAQIERKVENFARRRAR